MSSNENFAIKITKFSSGDIDTIRRVIGEDSFVGSTLTLDVDATRAKKLMQYWEDNECEFNIKCRNKNIVKG